VAIVFGVLLLFAAFGLGAWLEQGGKSSDEDYEDE